MFMEVNPEDSFQLIATTQPPPPPPSASGAPTGSQPPTQSEHNKIILQFGFSHMVRDGDEVECTISKLQPLKAEPEDMPLDIVYEDEHVLVVNKLAHMVVHPAPGNATGTLVNGILHHCSLSTFAFPNQEVLSEMEEISDDEFSCFSPGHSGDEDVSSAIFAASVRPGIVHRLDKGTSGLLLVAKDEQFSFSLG